VRARTITVAVLVLQQLEDAAEVGRVIAQALVELQAAGVGRELLLSTEAARSMAIIRPAA
jgi:hypothetical protein